MSIFISFAIGILVGCFVNMFADVLGRNSGKTLFASLEPSKTKRPILLPILLGTLFLSISVTHTAPWGLMGLFLTLLILLIVLDLEYKWVPHWLTLGGTAVALLTASFNPTNSTQLAVLGALAGGTVLFCLMVLGRYLFGAEAMGFGDVTTAVFIGAILGLPKLIFALPLAFLAGGLVSILLLLVGVAKRGDHLPYAHYLAYAAIFMLLYGDLLLNFYTRLFL